MLGRISTVFPDAATCEIEVGVPEVNFNGSISDEFAQVTAAKAADEAARIVFRERQPTVLVCEHFRRHMERIMGDWTVGLIPGTRITSFKTLGVPRKKFP
jgi:GTP cyclohydrolase I